jgi:hypothetical protein
VPNPEEQRAKAEQWWQQQMQSRARNRVPKPRTEIGVSTLNI